MVFRRGRRILSLLSYLSYPLFHFKKIEEGRRAAGTLQRIRTIDFRIEAGQVGQVGQRTPPPRRATLRATANTRPRVSYKRTLLHHYPIRASSRRTSAGDQAPPRAVI